MADRCDAAGVIDLDAELASFCIGENVTDDDLLDFGNRLQLVCDGKWRISKFIQFQYGKLSRECKPHRPVFEALSRYGIDHRSVEQNEQFVQTVESYIRDKIIKRDGLVCIYTQKALTLDDVRIDHVVPRSRGGTNKPDNLVVSCSVANALKSNLSVEEYCRKAGLDFEAVSDRIKTATSKAIEGYSVGIQYLQEKEKDQEKDREKEGEIAKRGFRKPTLEQVKLQAAKIGLPESEAEKFLNHYEANGWRVGPNPMRSFTHAMGNWKKNYDERRYQNGSQKHGHVNQKRIEPDYSKGF